MTPIQTPPIAAEHLFSIGSFPVTNAYLNSLFTVLIVVVGAYFIRRKLRDVPTGAQNFAESVLELMLSYADRVTGDRAKSMRLLPLAGSLFLFIIISNWVGILPGIGSIGIYHMMANGARDFIPLFRSANSDLNLTLAMAAVSIITVHILGVTTIGFFRYANKFIRVCDIWQAVRSGSIEKIFTAIVEFGVGLLEIISEISKILSLSLRLFGNIFAGEVLLTVLSAIVAYIVPLPFLGLELLVGLIQALVFSMLVLVYTSVATMPLPDHNGHTDDDFEKAHGLAEIGRALQNEHREPISGM
jgi:F-type H+-transporting ATPase subunit a